MISGLSTILKSFRDSWRLHRDLEALSRRIKLSENRGGSVGSGHPKGGGRNFNLQGVRSAMKQDVPRMGQSPLANHPNRMLRKCRRGHLTEVAELHEPAKVAVWSELNPGAPINPLDSGILFDPSKTCVHCVNDWLAEEFKLEPVTEPEVEAAYRMGGFAAAVACLQGLRTQSVEDAFETMALTKGRPLTDDERRIIKEVMGGGE